MPMRNGTKRELLKDSDVSSFTDWLAGVFCGTVALDYIPAPGECFTTLSSARQAYRWPPKTVTVPAPTGPIVLPRWSGLRQNDAVLRSLSAGLRAALKARPRDEKNLAQWIRAILVWGGVYTKKGNAAWLSARLGKLGPYMDRTLTRLASAHRKQDIDKLTDLRSNAGTTKVHALALDDFIIYDSRVAAALSWLVVKWACATSRGNIPLQLRFGCMRPNTKDRKKRRTPDERLFPYFAPLAGNLESHRKHAWWNLRANWILSAALGKAHQACAKECEFQSLRDVEAALFVMGADLSHAIPAIQLCIEKFADPSKRRVSTWRVEELEPVSRDRITRQDITRILDGMMIGDHRYWSAQTSEKGK